MSTFSKPSLSAIGPSLAAKTALGLAALAGAASAYSTSEHARLQSTLDVLKANPGAAGGAVRFKLNGLHDAARNATERGSLVGALSAAASCAGPGTRVFRDVGGKREKDHRKAGLDMWYECAVAGGTGKDTLKALTALSTSPAWASTFAAAVTTVEPQLTADLFYAPNDPLLSSQPHYPAIDLMGAWSWSKGDPNVVVQVLDTGIDMSHPDLQMNIWTNTGEICGNGIDDDNNGYVDDCHGYNHADDTGTDLLGNHWHGSHCGGTIAADNNNGLGVAGVAGGDGSANSGAKLMISVGFGKTAVGGFAEALVYGADMGAQISSNSWGYKQSNSYEQALLDAIDYANDKGSLVVFAAGNHAETEKRYPAAYAGAVAVAATDDGGAMASFSNHGGWVDVAAPGVAVVSTIGGGRYASSSGTSMAAPHVAGVLALGASLDTAAGGRPTRAALLACLSSTARDVDAVNAKPGKPGAGLVDAEAFVACAAGDDEDAARDAAAPRQLEIAGVKRMAATGLVSWTSDDDEAFAVAYKTKADKRWTATSDSFRAYARESDGKYYQALPGVACDDKVMVRVSAASGATAKTSWKKLKC